MTDTVATARRPMRPFSYSARFRWACAACGYEGGSSQSIAEMRLALVAHIRVCDLTKTCEHRVSRTFGFPSLVRHPPACKPCRLRAQQYRMGKHVCRCWCGKLFMSTDPAAMDCCGPHNADEQNDFCAARI